MGGGEGDIGGDWEGGSREGEERGMDYCGCCGDMVMIMVVIMWVWIILGYFEGAFVVWWVMEVAKMDKHSNRSSKFS